MPNYMRKYRSLYSTTLSTSIGTGTGETITFASVTNVPTTTEVTMTIDRVDSSGTATPSKMERITGTLSGSNLTSYARGADNTTDQAHAAGAVVEMVWNAADWNASIDGFLVQHSASGVHSNGFLVAAMLSASAINASAINASAVTAGTLAASSVTAGTLAANAVVSGNLSASSIVLGNLSASSVSAGNLNFSTGGVADGWTEAANTWTYSSVDGATGVITINADVTALIQAGDRIKLTQTTAKYFIVTKTPTFADSVTTLTFWGGTDFTLANAAITSPFYSHQKSPFGMNISPLKWSTEFNDAASRSQGTPTIDTWYNVGTSLLDIPIGAWKVNYQCVCFSYQETVTTINIQTSLSTSNNSVSDADLNGYVAVGGASGTVAVYGTLNREKILLLASKTTHYLIIRPRVSAATVDFKGDLAPTIIRAVCAYL